MSNVYFPSLRFGDWAQARTSDGRGLVIARLADLTTLWIEQVKEDDCFYICGRMGEGEGEEQNRDFFFCCVDNMIDAQREMISLTKTDETQPSPPLVQPPAPPLEPLESFDSLLSNVLQIRQQSTQPAPKKPATDKELTDRFLNAIQNFPPERGGK